MTKDKRALNGFKGNSRPTKRNGSPLSERQMNYIFSTIDRLHRGEPLYKTTPPLEEPKPDYSEI